MPVKVEIAVDYEKNVKFGGWSALKAIRDIEIWASGNGIQGYRQKSM
jgi:hypothetical protein